MSLHPEAFLCVFLAATTVPRKPVRFHHGWTIPESTEIQKATKPFHCAGFPTWAARQIPQVAPSRLAVVRLRARSFSTSFHSPPCDAQPLLRNLNSPKLGYAQPLSQSGDSIQSRTSKRNRHAFRYPKILCPHNRRNQFAAGAGRSSINNQNSAINNFSR